jgi:hypothetical protein
MSQICKLMKEGEKKKRKHRAAEKMKRWLQ